MWARKNKEINPRRLERRVLCSCQMERQGSLGHLDWRRMCSRNSAPLAGGALSSWQQPGGSFYSLSTLGDLAGGFDFRIQGEELWILVFTTYLELEAMVHLPEFPFFFEQEAEGPVRLSKECEHLRLPTGSTWAQGAGVGIEENSPFLFPSEIGLLWSLFSLCLLPEGWFFYLWGASWFLVIANCFLLGVNWSGQQSTVALGAGIWASSSGSAAGDQDDLFSLNCGFLICGWVTITVPTAMTCGDEEIGEGKQGMDCCPGLHWSTRDQQMIAMGMNRAHGVIHPPRSQLETFWFSQKEFVLFRKKCSSPQIVILKNTEIHRLYLLIQCLF